MDGSVQHMRVDSPLVDGFAVTPLLCVWPFFFFPEIYLDVDVFCFFSWLPPPPRTSFPGNTGRAQGRAQGRKSQDEAGETGSRERCQEGDFARTSVNRTTTTRSRDWTPVAVVFDNHYYPLPLLLTLQQRPPQPPTNRHKIRTGIWYGLELT